MAVQFHPEFKSKPLKPHPLFAGFVEASHQHKVAPRVGRAARRWQGNRVQPVTFAGLTIGGGAPLLLIAGPCVIESEAHAVETALALRDIAARAGVPFIFKASYDKANRTSSGFVPRARAGRRACACSGGSQGAAGVPILTDIHEPAQAARPPRSPTSCRSRRSCRDRPTCSIAAARTGRVVNIKKGQFLAPLDMRHAIEKVTAARQPAT